MLPVWSPQLNSRSPPNYHCLFLLFQRDMLAQRCGLVSLLLNTKGPLPPSVTKLLSFAVNNKFYFTGQFSGLLGGLSPNHWATKVASRVQWEKYWCLNAQVYLIDVALCWPLCKLQQTITLPSSHFHTTHGYRLTILYILDTCMRQTLCTCVFLVNVNGFA